MPVAPPESISWKSLESGVVVLNLESGSYYTLNETASLVWKLFVANNDEKRIVSELVKRYDCEKEEAAADVRMQLDQLRDEGLLVETP